ncbi:MAG TPA: hypothetical protein PKJ45_09790 [Rubrivivax sp.]|nr:hypothetical protein [Rubrivivax sp.]
MLDLSKWCIENEESVQKHKLLRLALDATKQAQAVGAVVGAD